MAIEYYTTDTCVIGLHNPKCAGSTLLARAIECLDAFEIYQNRGFVQNLFEERSEFLYLRDARRLRFIFGHSVHAEMLRYIDPASLLFTGIRHPVKRVLSQYNYEVNLATRLGHEPPDFHAFVDAHRDQLCWSIIPRFKSLLGDDAAIESEGPARRAYAILQSFDLIYDEHTFEQCADTIFTFLDLTPSRTNDNVGRYEKSLNVDTDYIEQQNECDMRLYDLLVDGGDLDVANWEKRRTLAMARRADWVRQPPNEPLLRNFLFGEMVKEYKYWGVIPETIALREKQIELIRAEIACMERIAAS